MTERMHTLVCLVEDQPGVLNRVMSLFRRRTFNAESVTVGHSEQPGLSRMTFVFNGDDETVEQVSKQLYKLLEVLKVTDITTEPHVRRELALIKVNATAQNRAASSPLLSLAPRATSRPSTISAANGGDVHASSGSAGTTS